MFNINYVIPIILSFNFILTELLKYKNEKMSKNITGLIYTVIFIIHHSYADDLEYEVHISIGYYIFDLYYMVKIILQDKTKLGVNMNYIIHHIISLYILYKSFDSKNFELILNGYYIFQNSNIVLYTSYYIHKEYPNDIKIKGINDFVQFIWYSYYRIIKMLYYLYYYRDAFFNIGWSLNITIFIIYMMGVLWSYKLLIQNINNYNNYIKYYNNK